MNTLIVYASKYGCAEKCANLLSKDLTGNVDLINIKENQIVNLSQYDKVIIGGSMYIGKIQKEVTAFCNKNLEILKEKAIGLFVCGMQEGDALQTELNVSFPKELMDIAKSIECFGGEFILDKMNFMEKMIVKKVSKVTSNTSNILEENIHKFTQIMNV